MPQFNHHYMFDHLPFPGKYLLQFPRTHPFTDCGPSHSTLLYEQRESMLYVLYVQRESIYK